ncbi:MAG TPA: PadR family transcriptional regulator [Alphaproteobacteria bacterium]|nr:PadR family transcriptional regulator [Alphaproteobacteria bacterium]
MHTHHRHRGPHHAMGRHFRRHGFAAHFLGGDGPGGRAFGPGRKLASGDLQLLILALIEEKPRHGYELIKEIEERSSGFYAPSPGMVYPALTYLEEIGHADIEAEGAKKLYRITAAGKAHLEANREVIQAMLAQLARAGRRMARVREFFAAEEADAAASSGGDAEAELYAARRALKLAIGGKLDAPPEEQRRVAEILKRATKELRGD